MGSTRKTNEKTRSRSRSPSERVRSTRERSRRDDKPPRKRSRRDPSDDEGSNHSEKDAPTKVSSKEHVRVKEERNEGTDDTPTGDAESLSIEDTNKLRAKLGLAPLDVGPAKGGDDDERMKTVEEQEVFVKTENISEKREAEKIRERVHLQKERRRILENLKSVKSLADDSDDEINDSLAWVQKSRDIEKKKAAAKARMLEEMDADIEKEHEENMIRRRQHKYKDSDLKDITVGHSKDLLKDGSQVILTLEDKDILDDEAEDVLVNVNLKEQEKAAENIENKKKGKNAYNPYDDGDEGEGKNLLYKYDEEIEGRKRETFKIGTQETVREKLAKLAEERKNSSKQIVSLESESGRVVAREYYTEEEMMKFKKPKKLKKKTLRRRDAEEEKLPLIEKTIESKVNLDNSVGVDDVKEPGTLLKKGLNIKLEDDVRMKSDDEDLSGIMVEDDEAQKELHAVLEKARKLKERARRKESSIAKIAEQIIVKREASDESELANNFVLDSTAEFCRTLGDIPTYGRAGNREDIDEDDDEKEMEVELERARQEEKISSEKASSSWSQVDDSDQASVYGILASKPILEEEPELTMGVAGALQLAMKKGYLEDDDKRNKSAPMKSSMSAQNYTIEEKFYDDDKSRKRGGGSHYNGPVSRFEDKSGYKPDVKLDYVDDAGRVLTQKEAFRVLSHKFHGKGSGKNKIDKRYKKLEQESKLRQMSSIDTPLNTVKKLQEKQKELQSPFVIISGGSANKK
ncbi:U4/U6.U5 tri-snRNP-associated protein 1 [Halotydeus destructor]|nr:U4/U6.U5 tri-snRNP-associated protein 1 [Halotydeus destructor]